MAETTSDLFSPYQLGELKLKNRFVMAPMTRCRADAGHVPSDLMATYYTQRASAGLIITESIHISPLGTLHYATPGLYTPEQVAGWQKITRAVHAAGSPIFAQLLHVGRLSHPAFGNGELPVAPSAILAEGEVYTATGKQARVTPRALDRAEIGGIVEQYRQAALNAREAGFDGVEIHGANGYLPDQFLEDGSNQRHDEYGGSPANRARFLLEVTEAVIGVWGKGRVGVRLSPSGQINKMSDSDPQATFGYAVRALAELDLAYLHLIEATPKELANPRVIHPVVAYFRPLYPGTLISCGGYSFESATERLANNQADLIAFARLYLANPDLPERFRRHAPLNPDEPATHYWGGPRGYTDYPTMEQVAQ